MTDLPTLKSLLARSKAATEPDREIDAQIWLALVPGATRKATVVKSNKGLWPDYTIDETRDATRRLITVPSYTSNISDAVALVKHVCQANVWEKWKYEISETDTSARAYFWGWRGNTGLVKRPSGQLPLALCEALLTALLTALEEGYQSCL